MTMGGQPGGMVMPYTGQNYIQYVSQGGQLLPMQPLQQPLQQQGGGQTGQMMVAGGQGGFPQFPLQGLQSNTMASTISPGCPWDCLIDETVPTMGRSHEDDALYEIFYTNPLHCCGTIVEIGAGNGEQYSTSYFFERGMNWTTILTEANPVKYEDMLTKRGEGEKVTTHKGAYCREGTFLYFDEASETFKSPIDSEETNAFTSEVMNSELEIVDDMAKVDCIHLDTVLKNQTHVNVMIIRVKGDPWAVVRTMDWDVQVDIWVILTEERDELLHATMRAALKLHDYVPAAWDIKLWCEAPGEDCVSNQVWLRKNFNPIHNPLLMASQHRGLRGGGMISQGHYYPPS